MSSLKRTDLVVMSTIDTRISRILNDASHLARATKITSPRDSFACSFCRLHCVRYLELVENDVRVRLG